MSYETNQIWSLVILILLLCMIGATIAIILVLNQNKFHFNKKLLKVESDFQENMLITRIEIQEQTFKHIAREIHDHIGQRLTMARLQINQLGDAVSILHHEKLFEASNMIEEAIADLKQLSRSITANVIREEGLLSALQIEVNRVKKIIPIEIELAITKEEESPFMPEENELIIYRILQEALQNIIKHAEARSVLIEMIYNNHNLTMRICDNGRGFDPVANTQKNNFEKSGLSNLKKRAEMLSGNFRIESEPGKGTSLIFQFPHQPTNPDHAAKQ
jgi:two-component system NarL family sensor kinase